ncbi:synaptic vesicle membrane protein VAT-1 homolog-like isoform X2 [Limulus polyphemus]|uniref:Synaptic vesicle membrane protein VAT-1 homolog-like isoform X2 n=1 Tax=Limulus polyphemus TaxID=6850 RepID=A0ABM1BE65_LIMPO|nr:synaptic vesicle membrane protein VAT-1 homolog-like isoform X2 [Limulus polyphemus]
MAETGNVQAKIPIADGNNDDQAKDEQPSPQKKIRALVLSGFGGLKSVKIMERLEPTVGKEEVLIRVKASGMNFIDLMVRQGVINNLPKTPFVMGFECAGKVEAVGEEVTELQVGDSVAALTEYKAWAELTNVPAKFVYKLPTGMSFQDATALLMSFVIAQILLFDIGNIRKGQSVLVHSVGGGVGQAVAQLCKTVPDVIVIGTASRHKHESIKDSVTHVIDHDSDYVQEVKKLSQDGVDLVLDCLCGDDTNKGYSLLKPLGRYVLYGTSNVVSGETKSFFTFAKSWWQVDKISPMRLFDENKSLTGFHLRHLLYQQGQDKYVRQVVNTVFELWSNGKIKPVIDSTWAFEDVSEAMQKLHDRKNIGKIILDPSMEPKSKQQANAGKDKETTDEKAVAGNRETEKVNKEYESSSSSSAK